MVISAVLLLVGSTIPLPPRFNPDFGPYGPDKFLHMIGHAGFAAALVAAFSDDDTDLRVLVTAIAASTAYGLVTELLQETIPRREFEQGDVVAGFLGSVIGVFGLRRLADDSI